MGLAILQSIQTKRHVLIGKEKAGGDVRQSARRARRARKSAPRVTPGVCRTCVQGDHTGRDT